MPPIFLKPKPQGSPNQRGPKPYLQERGSGTPSHAFCTDQVLVRTESNIEGPLLCSPRNIDMSALMSSTCSPLYRGGMGELRKFSPMPKLSLPKCHAHQGSAKDAGIANMDPDEGAYHVAVSH